MTTLTHPTPSSSAAPSSACAACKYQRRKCTSDCTLAPFFPADKQRQFLNVHRLYGVSNILKILKSVDQPLRHDAINSIIFQSNIRAQDPSGGCYRVILDLQRQIEATYSELHHVLSQIALIRSQFDSTIPNIQPDDDSIYDQQQQQHYYTNLYLHSDVQQDMNSINVGNEELPQQMNVSNEDGVDEENEKAEMNISNGSTDTVPCSLKKQVKAETSLVLEQAQEQDLKSAASFFTLQNCNTSAT